MLNTPPFPAEFVPGYVDHVYTARTTPYDFDTYSEPMLSGNHTKATDQVSNHRRCLSDDTVVEDDVPRTPPKLSIIRDINRGHARKGCFFLAILVVSTAGLATLLLAWLLLHEIKGHNVWRDRAFLVNEGTKLDGGREASRLVGLTISSTSVCRATSVAFCNLISV